VKVDPAKIVGVVKVTDQNGNENTALKNAANASMAKVLDGRVNRVALDVRGAKGGVFTYEIAYQAMDFTGHTSTVKCYVQVIR
jgi:C-terminal processing protease CtpA/Prc